MKKHNRGMPLITDLFDKRKKSLRLEASNLQLEDVKEDKNFNATVEKFKKKYLFNPVKIEEPEIKRHQASIKKYPPNYENPMGGEREVYEIIIAFPFSGSPELFEVIPLEVKYPTGMVYAPVGSNITLDIIELNELNKDKAYTEAKNRISTTQAIIKENNIQAKRWNEEMVVQIEQLLNKQRKQIIDFNTN